jgi:hypothetical protein
VSHAKFIIGVLVNSGVASSFSAIEVNQWIWWAFRLAREPAHVEVYWCCSVRDLIVAIRVLVLEGSEYADGKEREQGVEGYLGKWL